MNVRSMRRAAVITIIYTSVIAACSEAPEALLASAKEYLVKNDQKAAVIQLKNVLQKNPKHAEARFLLGKALLSSDVLGAEKELRQALELGYPIEQVAPPLARAMVMLGRYKEVIAGFANVAVTTPQEKAEFLTSLGQAQLAVGNARAARDAFTLALTAQPRFVPAHLGEARVFLSDGNLAEASARIDAALAISDKDAEAWQFKGDLLVAQRQLDPAVAAYRKAVEARPDFVPGHSALIALLMQREMLDDAAKQLSAMKQVAPGHPQTFYMQALLGYRRSDFAAARTAIQQQLRQVPDNTQGLLLAAAVEYKLKSYAQAEVHALKALQRAPGQPFARRLLIVTYLRGGQPGKALDILSPVLNQIDEDAAMLALAGEVFMMNDDAVRAARYFTKAASLAPGDVRKRTAAAMSHLALGESDRAIRELNETSAIDSGVGADLAVIAVHTAQGQHERALAAIAKLEKKQPATPLPHNLRGSVLASKRDISGARGSFERALEIDPAYLPAAANLAKLDLSDNRPDVARQRFEAVLQKDPQNSYALLALAGIREQVVAVSRAKEGGATRSPAKSDEQVVGLINKAIAIRPSEAGPRLALIRYYIRAKDAQKAVLAAQQASAAIPDRPEIMAAAAEAYHAAGDTLQTLAIYNKLAALQRGNPQPYVRMAEVQLASKNNKGAMDSLRKALAIKPDLIEAQRGIIKLNLEAGGVGEAISVAREIQKQRPRDEIGYVFEGDIHAQKKNWAEAMAVYKAGLVRVSSSNLALRLHSVLDASGGEAQRFAATWLRDHPNDDPFRQYVAELAATKKDYPTAVQHFRNLVDRHPKNAFILNNLAWVEAQLKHPKALEHAERSNALAPNQPRFMDTLGAILVDRGHVERGLELLKKASAADPQAAAIRLNLAKALIKAGQKDLAQKELDELAKLGNKFSDQSEVRQLRQGF
jgi:putative PEP-CTERM system TPR-repeat lipoprotein